MLISEFAAQQAPWIVRNPAQPLLHGLRVFLGPRFGIIRLRLALFFAHFPFTLFAFLFAFLL